MTGTGALGAAIARLRAAGITDAVGDARRLLAYALAIAPDRLTLHLTEALSPDSQQRYEAVLIQRLARQPVSQIVGTRLFWGRVFTVTPAVLDPRPETECLIAEALKAAFVRVLDLGTGSGCILLTLLAERRGRASGLGVDLSPEALVVAHENRQTLQLEAAADLQQGSWYAPVREKFDLIVSNPPYLAADEMVGLAPEVRDWEPRLALTPEGDGLDAYRAISAGAPAHLAEGGRILVEIGPTQAAAVAHLFTAAGLARIAVVADMDGRDRVLVARR